eukprot:CAMPEP_0182540776 /NCGR_PEP_ID=MMETSP1323-20130603/27620_1 /TAXON_ID=236787 /ORGANISM="Florenciella parvula, Strain RCC1693" /LENGTH=49 /DNA_ID=CAMNT_0024751473 /DNA_START=168 /DNA_END=317 /DNA_ORIENTATION=-
MTEIETSKKEPTRSFVSPFASPPTIKGSGDSCSHMASRDGRGASERTMW